MAYEYKVLTDNEKDEMLTHTIMAQETDLYIHQLNKERYESLIADESVSDVAWKKRIGELLEETNSRIAEVESIIKHLSPQLPPQVRIDEAKARIKAREDAAQGIVK